jgi:glycosyltransferase involved in cell wall biosynthesis
MPAHDRRRVLFVATHPVQYGAPVFRRMAADPRLEIKVAYLCLAGAKPTHDPGFGTTVQWDVPLLDGYPWVELQRPHARSLRRLLDEERWDAIVLHAGYRYRIFWSAVRQGRMRDIPVLFGTDATSYATQVDGSGSWKFAFKRLVLPWIFRLADVAVVPSSRSRQFLLGMGLKPGRIVVTPYVVDNDWWKRAAGAADRDSVRRAWSVPLDATVFLYCAKLQPWKRPHDLLEAFARLNRFDVYLVFAGEGPLRADLERRTGELDLGARVRFLGFTNQRALPGTYKAADFFVLPSAYEPFGVVVNEAMLCGCVPIVSDHVGAGGDLVPSEKVGFVYPAGDVGALTAVMQVCQTWPLDAMRRAGSERINAWSPELNIDRLVEAVDQAGAAKH